MRNIEQWKEKLRKSVLNKEKWLNFEVSFLYQLKYTYFRFLIKNEKVAEMNIFSRIIPWRCI